MLNFMLLKEICISEIFLAYVCLQCFVSSIYMGSSFLRRSMRVIFWESSKWSVQSKFHAVEEKFKLKRESNDKRVDSTHYKSLIESLRYLTTRRPYIITNT
jgi:hypothetical protein